MNGFRMSAAGTRDRIVELADELFYAGGFDSTSFADIADAVKISRGNFYYHFKTKDEILQAVIDRRMAERRTMMDRWESEGASPRECIGRFIDILIVNQPKIMAHGCPIGTLCAELAKLDHAQKNDAAGLFTLFRNWLRSQFEKAGCGDASDDLAMHLLMRSQGVASLANAFGDEAFVRREVDAMHAWLEARIGEAGSIPS